MTARIASFRSFALIGALGLTFLLSGKALAQSPVQGKWFTGPGDNVFGVKETVDIGPGQFNPTGSWTGNCTFYQNGVLVNNGTYKFWPVNQFEGECTFFWFGGGTQYSKVNLYVPGMISIPTARYIRVGL
jgi:hypothetical protein